MGRAVASPTGFDGRRRTDDGPEFVGWDKPAAQSHQNPLVLHLQAAPEGGYVVTSPLDPELITEAETIDEAFANARDAAAALKRSRLKLLRSLSASKTAR